MTPSFIYGFITFVFIVLGFLAGIEAFRAYMLWQQRQKDKDNADR